MKPLVAIYYRRQDWERIKDIASRARNDGAEVRPVWSTSFTGAESMLRGASAVIVQQEASGAEAIIKCYGELGNNVEIHLCDEKGEFVDLGGSDDDSKHEQVESDPVVPEETADSSASADEDTPVVFDDDADAGTSEADSEPEAKPTSSRSKRRSRKSVQDETSTDVRSDGEDNGAE